jgi:O-antigen ligase
MTNSSESHLPAVISYWPVLLLTGFGSVLVPLAPMLGYRWSGELTLAILLLAAALHSFTLRRSSFEVPPSHLERHWILLPLSLLVIWSFLSIVWSASWRAALHHSLLWSCYLTFYFVVRHSIANEEKKGSMLKILGFVLLPISLAGIVGYLTESPASAKLFNERFYSYAEVVVTLLPLLVAYGIGAERKWSRLALIVTLTSWAMVLATTSRAMLIGGLAGLAIFLTLSRLVIRPFENPKRWLAIFGSLVFVAILFLVPFWAQDRTTVLQRIAGADEFSVKSADARLLFWGLAIEGFHRSPLIGIGADNYFFEYKRLREDRSARYPNSTVLEINEELIPERAHNEYLQILAELGIVGAVLFGWFLVGIGYLFWLAYKKKAPLLAIGALSGMVAFLVASGASSYSFRLPANGICFFFLLAVASSELFGSKEDRVSSAPRLVPILGLAVSVAMIAFSLVRANSIRHMTNALNAKDESVRMAAIENAIAIDPSEPMFRFYYGQWLERSGEHDPAIAQMRVAIDNGLADSLSFFRLAAAQINAGRPRDAEETFAEALRVYPRSVFLRTAFASFLKKRGDDAGAAAEYESALSINEKQARSWQLAHDEGLERLVQTARVDDRYVSTFDLRPESAPLVLSNFQRSDAGVLP